MKKINFKLIFHIAIGFIVAGAVVFSGLIWTKDHQRAKKVDIIDTYLGVLIQQGYLPSADYVEKAMQASSAPIISNEPGE